MRYAIVCVRKHKFISQSKNIMVLGLNTNLFILFFIYISIQILQSKFSMLLLSKQHSHIKTTLIICTWNAIKFSHFFYNVFFSSFFDFLAHFVRSYTIFPKSDDDGGGTIAYSTHTKKRNLVYFLHLRVCHKQNMNHIIIERL